ncbi:hypothetical protein ACLMJK_001651 [Lecanora helva]
MTSPIIQEQSPLVVFLKTDPDHVEFGVLKKENIEPKVNTTKAIMSITECDDSDSEDHTPVEDTGVAPSDTKPTKNEKSTGDQLSEHQVRSDKFRSRGRSRSCLGRVQEILNASTLVNNDHHELHGRTLKEQARCGEGYLERHTLLDRQCNVHEGTTGQVASTSIKKSCPFTSTVSSRPNSGGHSSASVERVAQLESSPLERIEPQHSQVPLQVLGEHRNVTDPIPDQSVGTTETQFPSEDSSSALAKFVTIFPQAKQWFEENSDRCLWQKDKKAKFSRCGNRIGKMNGEKIGRCFEILEKTAFSQQGSEASQCLDSLANLGFCTRNHRQDARARIQSYLGEYSIQNQGETTLPSRSHETELEISRESTGRLTRMPLSRQGQGLMNALTISSTDTGDDRFRFVPYQIPAKALADHSAYILELARKAMTKSELCEGYIYVYWNRTTFGAYKIGYTTRDIDKRLQDWASQCKHEAQRTYPPPAEIAIPVPHVRRVEKLIHADLIKYRVKEIGCLGCHRDHIEWFHRIDETLIKAKIKAWTWWIMSDPYEQSGEDFKLNKSGEDVLKEICKGAAVNPGSLSPFEGIDFRSARSVSPGSRKRSGLRPRYGRKDRIRSSAPHSYNTRSRRA